MIVKHISEVLCETAIYEEIFTDILPLVIPQPTGNYRLDNFALGTAFESYDIRRKATGECIIGINKSLEMSTRVNKKWLSSNRSDMFSSAISIVIEENGKLKINKSRLKYWICEYGIPASKDTRMNVFAYLPKKDMYAFCSYIPVNKFCSRIGQLYCCFNLWKSALDNNITNIKKYSRLLKPEVETANEAFGLLSHKIKDMLVGFKIRFNAIPEYSLFYNEANSIYSLLFYQLACYISGKDSTKIRLRTCEVCGELFYANHGNDKYCGKYTGKKGCNKSAAYMKRIRNQEK